MLSKTSSVSVVKKETRTQSHSGHSTSKSVNMMHQIGDSLKAFGEKTVDLFKKDEKDDTPPEEKTPAEAFPTVAEAIAQIEKDAKEADNVNLDRALESALFQFQKVSDEVIVVHEDPNGDIKTTDLKFVLVTKTEVVPTTSLDPAGVTAEKALETLNMQ